MVGCKHIQQWCARIPWVCSVNGDSPLRLGLVNDPMADNLLHSDMIGLHHLLLMNGMSPPPLHLPLVLASLPTLTVVKPGMI